MKNLKNNEKFEKFEKIEINHFLCEQKIGKFEKRNEKPEKWEK